jgi:DNA (cytosine-5)-methyltransferase 1
VLLTHCDLFSGLGGFRTGLAQAGFNTLVAVEKDPNCVATYRANHASVPILHADIRDVRDADLVRLCGSVTLMTAGIPCEVWSSARSMPAATDDPRRTLYREVIRLAETIQPRFVLLENVPRITASETWPGSGRHVVEEIRSALRWVGYGHQREVVLDAADFGVPSRRRRWSLLAALDPKLRLRAPTTTGRHMTVRYALAGLPLRPCDTPEARDGGPGWHVAAGIGRPMLARYSLVRPGKRVADLLESLPLATVEAFKSRRILPPQPYRQRGYRLHLDHPAPTLTAHCADELIHPEACRRLTVRECSRLQGIPDWYEFFGPLNRPHNSEPQDIYAMIGECVCPPVARAWGEAIKEMICEEA